MNNEKKERKKRKEKKVGQYASEVPGITLNTEFVDAITMPRKNKITTHSQFEGCAISK